MKKKAIKLICFLLILIFLSINFHKIFSFKGGDGIMGINIFYKQKENSIDLICFGSSHIFENVNTGILWDDYGIAAFDLCGSIQPLWNTYFYMKEALKTQHPKVMVLDLYTATRDEEYGASTQIIKNNYGLKLSSDKINSIKISAPQEMWHNYFLEYPTYHSRYSELGKIDFVPHSDYAKEYWKGFSSNLRTIQINKPNVNSVYETKPLTSKNEEYLIKIIQLSKEQNIPLLLIATPYQLTSEDQKRFNYIAQLAAKYNVPFINYNLMYDIIGLDFNMDFADTHHLNYRGNVKFTRYLASYLKANYEIPDRRNDIDYQSYDFMAADCRQKIYNQELKEISDINAYLPKLQNENYLIIYTISGDYKNLENYIDIKNKLALFNINLDAVESNAAWVFQNNKLIFSSGNEQMHNWHTDVGSMNCLAIKPSENENNSLDVYLNSQKYVAVKQGLNLVIYDTLTDTLVESAGFPISRNRISFEKHEQE
ncbi:MAG: hypothetical protein HFI03_00650 [Lachnospiraceae bacterium]|jgi:hypothetical protein|nr:hypothetical protein [Lachnospiraceae bacterium]